MLHRDGLTCFWVGHRLKNVSGTKTTAALRYVSYPTHTFPPLDIEDLNADLMVVCYAMLWCGVLDSGSACVATKRIVLSGTPIQNDLEELFAILQFVLPRSILGEQKKCIYVLLSLLFIRCLAQGRCQSSKPALLILSRLTMSSAALNLKRATPPLGCPHSPS